MNFEEEKKLALNYQSQFLTKTTRPIIRRMVQKSIGGSLRWRWINIALRRYEHTLQSIPHPVFVMVKIHGIGTIFT